MIKKIIPIPCFLFLILLLKFGYTQNSNTLNLPTLKIYIDNQIPNSYIAKSEFIFNENIGFENVLSPEDAIYIVKLRKQKTYTGILKPLYRYIPILTTAGYSYCKVSDSKFTKGFSAYILGGIMGSFFQDYGKEKLRNTTEYSLEISSKHLNKTAKVYKEKSNGWIFNPYGPSSMVKQYNFQKIPNYIEIPFTPFAGWFGPIIFEKPIVVPINYKHLENQIINTEEFEEWNELVFKYNSISQINKNHLYHLDSLNILKSNQILPFGKPRDEFEPTEKYYSRLEEEEFLINGINELFSQYLIKVMGYRESNILLYSNATLSNMNIAFNKLKNFVKVGKSDVIVYYFGHGASGSESKQGFFVPVDADINYIKETGYAIDDLYNLLNELDVKSTMVVIDACFSGSSDQKAILKDISPVFIEVENDDVLKGNNSNIFTSSTGEQVSSCYREKKHSLFTYYFLKALKGEGDLNIDNKLTIS